MKVSLTLFGLNPLLYPELAVHCEEIGVETLWLSDHLLTPATFGADYPYSESGRPGYDTRTTLNDVWVLIAYLSALTKNLQFGTGVFILPLRSPFVTALSLATACRLSQERLLLGVGSGWMREEFDAVGEDFDTRGGRLEECLDVIEGLLTGAEFEHHGRFFDFAPSAIGGAPVSRLPVIFGGVREVVLRRTARRGDGWFGPVCPLEESSATADALDRLRDDGPLAGKPLMHYPRLFGEPTYENLERYREAGFDRVVLSGGPLMAGLDSRAARADTLEAIVGDALKLAN
jgi:probable F420-dependent oxidoreductase